MILKKDFISNEDTHYPILAVLGNESEEDDEVVIQFVTPYTISEVCVTPEVLSDYINTLQAALNSILIGEFEGPS